MITNISTFLKIGNEKFQDMIYNYLSLKSSRTRSPVLLSLRSCLEDSLSLEWLSILSRRSILSRFLLELSKRSDLSRGSPTYLRCLCLSLCLSSRSCWRDLRSFSSLRFLLSLCFSLRRDELDL